MALFLVQHGKSLPKEKDPERGLSEEGIQEVKCMAGLAKAWGIRVTGIMHSGKKRARQTAEIFASALNPEQGVRESQGLDPLDDVAGFASRVDPGEDRMLVGHLPFMEKMASYLVTGSVENPVVRFRNGGILCLDKGPGDSTWLIQWAAVPELCGKS